MSLVGKDQMARTSIALAGAAVFMIVALLVDSIFSVGAFLSIAVGSVRDTRSRNVLLMACALVAVLVLAYQFGKWLAVSERCQSGVVMPG
jgi:hypothetical protein